MPCWQLDADKLFWQGPLQPLGASSWLLLALGPHGGARVIMQRAWTRLVLLVSALLIV